MSNYALANRSRAWYQDRYPGATINPNAGVIHTTETTGLPGYDGGKTAPNYTAVPNIMQKRLDWFAHFPDERSSRALVNSAGGVETNTLNVIQVELVGTCDPATHAKWIKAGVQHIYWPEAPDWALQDLAHFIVDMNLRHGILIQGPKLWQAYPGSYGESNSNRFSYAEWRNFYGWCGHQHVPENSHGDPGAFPWARVAAFASELLGDPKPVVAVNPPPKHLRKVKPTRITEARTLIQQALALLDEAVDGGRTGYVQQARDDIRRTLKKTLPRR